MLAAALSPTEGVKLKPAKVLGFACRDAKEVSLDNVGSRAALTGVAEAVIGVPKLPNAGAGVEDLDDAGAGDPVVDLRPGKPRILQRRQYSRYVDSRGPHSQLAIPIYANTACRNLRSRSYFLVRSLLEPGAAIDDLDLIVAVFIVNVAVCQVFLRSSLPRHIYDRTLATFGWSIGNDQPETAAFLQYVDSCYHSLLSMQKGSRSLRKFDKNP